MMPLQTIILLTTGFLLPPVLSVVPGAQSVAGPDDGLHAVLVAAPLHEVAEAQNIEAGGPWLGIQFGPVPKPLAAHLGIDPGEGQMVLNVVEGSPADEAGIQQYDVILKIDGNPTSADVADFLNVVRGFEPGQTHDFALIRQGNNTQVSVTVGKRPDSTEPPTYKYEAEIGPFSQGKVFQRGGVLQKGPGGTWNFEALDKLNDLPNIWKLMPKQGAGDMTFAWKGDGRNGNGFQFTLQGGTNLQIKRGEDGQITVTKTEEVNGNKKTSTSTYANEEEFKAADPEAFKAYKGSFQFHVLGDLKFPGLHFGDKGALGGFLFKGDDGDMDVDIQRLMEESQKRLKDHHALLKKVPGAYGDAAASALFFTHKPSVSFDVDPDGAIRVTIRQGEDELIENYDNAAQLEDARPELYEKYQNLKQAKPE